jgi:inosine-uridine nucleoside N-ribohydrolase
MRLWIDTDLQPDDLIALRCARRHPDVELAGVSGVGVPPRPADLAEIDALLAIGPLTSVAPLVERGEVPPPVVVMGGAVRPVVYRGRERDVESNFRADPAAAATVLGHVRTRLVPLDVTASVLLDDTMEQRLIDVDPELAIAVARWRRELRADGVGDPELAVGLHDALAFLTLVDDALFETQTMPLVVDTNGAVHVDQRGTEHDVVVGVDRERAVDRILTLFLDARR